MQLSIEIFNYELKGKEVLISKTFLEEGEDYFYNEDKKCFVFIIDTACLHKGDVLHDFYDNIETLRIQDSTKYLFERLKLRSHDETIFSFVEVLEVQAKYISNFASLLLQYYNALEKTDYYYFIENDHEISSLIRFKSNDVSYKLDSYESFHKNVDFVELVNYQTNETIKISVSDKEEIEIFGEKFRIHKKYFIDDKIRLMKKILELVKVTYYYKEESDRIKLLIGY